LNIITMPTKLTLARMVLSPLMLPLFLVCLLPYDLFWLNGLLGLLFVGFSLTDFLDGFLARRYHLESALGTMLDPIADKFLFYSVLVALLAAHKLFFYWVIILIGRELFMMSLRQIALEHQFSIPVSKLGKMKTAFQMVCLTFIIVNPYQKLGFTRAFGWNGLELLLLVVTTSLSLWSSYRYFQQFVQKYRDYLATQSKNL
jgi:CDP-diacylglycerol--glycerol-3-phosphate 3-phosphatidyltransferase